MSCCSPYHEREMCPPLVPEEDVNLIDEVNDSELLAIAEDRLKNYDPAALISGEEMNRRLGITEEDLAGFEEVEIE